MGKKTSMHKHWIFGRKLRENKSHSILVRHERSSSQCRHDLETGKLQRWLKKRGLHMTDGNKDLYMREVYGVDSGKLPRRSSGKK